jgi:hypothetical protein
MRFFIEQDDSWIPEPFKRHKADAAAGRVVEMESALRETRPHLR